jgi:hypothetical protein
MKQIKFSERYYKLMWDKLYIPKQATLMEVFKTTTECLHPTFIEYDTIFLDEKTFNDAHYELPKGEILVLLFKTEKFVFTTIRRYTPEKYNYYLKSRGEEFEIVLIQ